MKKIIALFLLFALPIIMVSQSFTAIYTFDSVDNTSGTIDPTPLPVATGVQFGAFTAKGTPGNANSGGRFSFTQWATGATAGNNNYGALTGTIDTSEYYSVTIAPASGYAISLDSIKFKVQRSGTGIRTYVVKSSIDNFNANLISSINPANSKLSVQQGNVFFWNYDSITSGQNGSFITLGASAYSILTSPVTFRFYAYNSESATGTFSIDDVIINGSSSISNGIKENSGNDYIIYPSPNSSGLITISSSLNEASISVYDITGKIIYSKKQNSFPAVIDLSGKENGIYFITLGNSTKKIIVSK